MSLNFVLPCASQIQMSAADSKSNAKQGTCRRSLLRVAGAVIGGVALNRAANAFDLPKFEIPKLELPVDLPKISLPGSGSSEKQKTSDEDEIDMSRAEDLFARLRKRSDERSSD